MAVDNDIRKTKIGLSLKRFFKLKFTKDDKKEKPKKDDNKEYDNDYYEHDALPTDKNTEEHSEKEQYVHREDINRPTSGNCNNGKTSPDAYSSTDVDLSPDEEEKTHSSTKEKHNKQKDNEKVPSDDNKRKEKRYRKRFNEEQFPVLNQTSIVVNNGTVHLGNVYNHVHNLQYNTSPQDKQSKKAEISKEIRALLKCQDKVEVAHLDVLSQHFGNQWKNIGSVLGMKTVELDSIEHDCKDLQNSEQRMAFKMLNLWSQEKGDMASVGELCKILLRGNIEQARKAVQKLSLLIEDIKS